MRRARDKVRDGKVETEAETEAEAETKAEVETKFEAAQSRFNGPGRAGAKKEDLRKTLIEIARVLNNVNIGKKLDFAHREGVDSTAFPDPI